MAKPFLLIDELTVDDHAYIDLEEDECYYLFNYTAHKDFSYSEANGLISNLKKRPSLNGTPQYKYKAQAIRKAAQIFRQALDREFIETVTFVPVPPSKARDHEDYDDRMLQILNLATAGEDADVREIIEQIESTEAFHLSNVRPSIRDLRQNLELIEERCDDLRETICIVDDMITNGTHFKAMKKIINRAFPNIDVIGLFICRRAIDKVEDFDE